MYLRSVSALFLISAVLSMPIEAYASARPLHNVEYLDAVQEAFATEDSFAVVVLLEQDDVPASEMDLSPSSDVALSPSTAEMDTPLLPQKVGIPRDIGLSTFLSSAQARGPPALFFQ